jgi:hypothetical protein
MHPAMPAFRLILKNLARGGGVRTPRRLAGILCDYCNMFQNK